MVFGTEDPLRRWRLGVRQNWQGLDRMHRCYHLKELTGTLVLACVMRLFSPELETWGEGALGRDLPGTLTTAT